MSSEEILARYDNYYSGSTDWDTAQQPAHDEHNNAAAASWQLSSAPGARPRGVSESRPRATHREKPHASGNMLRLRRARPSPMPSLSSLQSLPPGLVAAAKELCEFSGASVFLR